MEGERRYIKKEWRERERGYQGEEMEEDGEEGKLLKRRDKD